VQDLWWPRWGSGPCPPGLCCTDKVESAYTAREWFKNLFLVPRCSSLAPPALRSFVACWSLWRSTYAVSTKWPAGIGNLPNSTMLRTDPEDQAVWNWQYIYCKSTAYLSNSVRDAVGGTDVRTTSHSPELSSSVSSWDRKKSSAVQEKWGLSSWPTLNLPWHWTWGRWG
jgi:hypothetical protein